MSAARYDGDPRDMDPTAAREECEACHVEGGHAADCEAVSDPDATMPEPVLCCPCESCGAPVVVGEGYCGADGPRCDACAPAPITLRSLEHGGIFAGVFAGPNVIAAMACAALLACGGAVDTVPAPAPAPDAAPAYRCVAADQSYCRSSSPSCSATEHAEPDAPCWGTHAVGHCGSTTYYAPTYTVDSAAAVCARMGGAS